MTALSTADRLQWLADLEIEPLPATYGELLKAINDKA